MVKIGPSGNWMTDDGEEIPGTSGGSHEAAASLHRSRHERGLDKAEQAAREAEREGRWERASAHWKEASKHHQAMSRIVKGAGGEKHASWAEETRLHAARTAREAEEARHHARRVQHARPLQAAKIESAIRGKRHVVGKGKRLRIGALTIAQWEGLSTVYAQENPRLPLGMGRGLAKLGLVDFREGSRQATLTEAGRVLLNSAPSARELFEARQAQKSSGGR